MKTTRLLLEFALSSVRFMMAEARSEIVEVSHSDEAESEMETIKSLWRDAKDAETLLCMAIDRLDNSSSMW